LFYSFFVHMVLCELKQICYYPPESATTTATKVTATTLSTTSTTSPLVNVSVPSSSAPFTEESIGQWLENLNNYDDNDDLFSNDEYGSDLVTGNGTTTTGATTTGQDLEQCFSTFFRTCHTKSHHNFGSLPPITHEKQYFFHIYFGCKPD